jgi:elongation factor G
MPFLVELAVEPRSRTDSDRLGIALSRLAAEDSGFGFSRDDETDQTVIKGQSEPHLVVVVDRLKRECAINVGAPQVAYCETLGRRVEIDYTHKKQFGSSGQFARIKLVFEPAPPGSGYHFESKIVGDSVPKEYVLGVEKGLEASRETGVLAGFPVIDFTAVLVDGAYHNVDSSVLAFEIAVRWAFKEALMKAQCRLLEPIMKVEVVTPEDSLGKVVADLNSRRGQVQGVEACGDAQVVKAMVGLADMFGYENTLRSMTQRRASYTIAFDHYAPVPMPPDDDDPSAPAVALRG